MGFKDYRKSLKEDSDKWWFHQYCLYKGISLSKVKPQDKLILDYDLTNELKNLESQGRTGRFRHKDRIIELDKIIANNIIKLSSSPMHFDWRKYDWNKHQVFSQDDISLMNTLSIDGYTIKAYEIEKFRDDMMACATLFGLEQYIINSRTDNKKSDKNTRVIKLLREICTGYSAYQPPICKNTNAEGLTELDVCMRYCRQLDKGIEKYTKSGEWKRNKEGVLQQAFEDYPVGKDNYAKVFRDFYFEYGTLTKKNVPKSLKLLELKLPNIDTLEMAKKIVKYSI